MLVTVFTTPEGDDLMFAPHQRLALERAGLWQTYGYTLKTQCEGIPTFRDSEIAATLYNYAGLTTIYRPGLTHVPNHPYNVRNRRASTDVPCVTIEAALDTVRELGCDVVAIPVADMEPVFERYAADRGITLLVA